MEEELKHSAIRRRSERYSQRTNILYTIVVVLFYLLHQTSSTQHFVVQPSSLTAKLGDRVTLPCKVAERKGVVQWTKDGFGLGTNRTLHGFDRYEMIGSIEEGEYNLYIRMVLASDDAEYQCQVGAAAGEPFLASSKAKLTVHVPPKDNEDMVSIDSRSPVTTVSGTPVRMSCIARSSKPAPEIKWYQDNKEITKGTNKTTLPLPDSVLVSVRNILDITPTKSHNNANISCQVTHVALDSPIVRSVKMEVKFPPEVTIKVDSAKIRAGDDVTFTCTAEGNPPTVSYAWELDGKVVVGEAGNTLLLPNVTKTMNKAVVRCMATNDVGTGKAEHTLEVEYAPELRSQPQNVDGDVGQQVKLKCDIDGNPKPEIVWTHQNSAKVIKIGASISVKVSAETVGTYHCRATSPGFKEIWYSMEVFARGPPSVVPDQIYYGLEGAPVTIQCKVDSMPRPNETYWSKEGLTILPSDRITIREEPTASGVVNTLTVHVSHLNDFGEYNCTSRNKYGSDTGLIVLYKQQSLPLITTLVAVIGGILFLITVVAAIVIFRKKGLDYKDDAHFEKHSMHSTDRSSTNDSMFKGDIRTGTYTGTGSDLTPSEDEGDEDGGTRRERDDIGDYTGTEDWSTTNIDDEEVGRMPSRTPHRYSADVQTGQTNLSGSYVPYVDYQVDYNPPPPPNHLVCNRNTIYTSVPLNNMGVNPRFNMGYNNIGAGQRAILKQQQIRGISGPQMQNQIYTRLPSNARMLSPSQPMPFGSTGHLAVSKQNAPAVFSPNLGPPNTNFGANFGQGPVSFGGGSVRMQNISNNLNDLGSVADKNVIYGQISGNRDNLRISNLSNSHIIAMPQNDLGRGGNLGTHI